MSSPPPPPSPFPSLSSLSDADNSVIELKTLSPSPLPDSETTGRSEDIMNIVGCDEESPAHVPVPSDKYERWRDQQWEIVLLVALPCLVVTMAGIIPIFPNLMIHS